MLSWLKSSPRFARFIRRQLYKAFNGDKAAQDCLAFYCMPKADELDDLGYSYSPEEMAKLGKCTDHGRLLAIVADGYT
jgi:hypothetical protein